MVIPQGFWEHSNKVGRCGIKGDIERAQAVMVVVNPCVFGGQAGRHAVHTSHSLCLKFPLPASPRICAGISPDTNTWLLHFNMFYSTSDNECPGIVLGLSTN